MNAVKWILMVYCVLAAKLALDPFLGGAAFLPDPVLTLAILALVTIDHPFAFAAAAAVGFCGDLLWSSRIGASMLCLLVVGYWLGGIRKWFALEAPARSICVAWFLAATVTFARVVLLRSLESAPYDLETIAVSAIWEGLLTGVAVFLIFFALERCGQALRTIFQPSAS